MLKFMVIQDPDQEMAFRPSVFMGSLQVWSGAVYATKEQAFDEGNSEFAGVLSMLFSIRDDERISEDPLLILDLIEPAWLEAEALKREDFHGKSFAENALDIIKERFKQHAS